MPPARRYTVVDVDSHVYEPTDIWERYLDRDYRVIARSAFWHELDAHGIEVTILNGRRARSLQEPSFAVRELERVAKRGFRAAFVRPVFFQGRFPNHPSYDALWKVLEDLDVAGCVHPSPGSTNPEWSSHGAFVERVAANLR